jgi:hypothetical protein
MQTKSMINLNKNSSNQYIFITIKLFIELVGIGKQYGIDY